MASAPFERGLHRLGTDTWAWLQPDGGWGWSNAGLVSAGGEALLVDTLFDLDLTAAMLEVMSSVAPRIETLVNTHANGDHCYGNGLVGGAEVIASTASAAEMDEVPASALGRMVAAAAAGRLGPAGDYVLRIFGGFRFEGIEPAPPTRTFDGELHLDVGGTRVQLLEVGPAHTGGDVVAHLPDRGVVFTGDLVFNGGHPIVWADLKGWVAACDRLAGLDVDVVVPGHGPVTDLGAVRFVRQYLLDLEGQARRCWERGLDVVSAANEVHRAMPEGWRVLGESERVVANVAAAYRGFSDGADGNLDTLTLFSAMAELAGPAGA